MRPPAPWWDRPAPPGRRTWASCGSRRWRSRSPCRSRLSVNPRTAAAQAACRCRLRGLDSPAARTASSSWTARIATGSSPSAKDTRAGQRAESAPRSRRIFSAVGSTSSKAAKRTNNGQTRSFLRRGVGSYPRVSAHTLLRGPPGAYARALLPYQSYVIQLESDRPTRIISPETSHHRQSARTHTARQSAHLTVKSNVRLPR